MEVTMVPVSNLYTLMRTIMLNTVPITGTTTQAYGFQQSQSGGCPVAVGIWKDTLDATYSRVANYYYRTSGSDDYYDGRFGLNCWTANNSKFDGSTNIVIGSNNADTQDDDNVLKAEIDSTKYEISLHMQNATLVGNKGVLPITVSITAKDSITLGEIGVLKCMNIGDSLHTKKDFLIARGALDNTVNLTSGETKTFQINISF